MSDARITAAIRGESIVVTEAAGNYLLRALDAVVAAVAPGDSIVVGAAVRLTSTVAVRGLVQAAKTVVFQVAVDTIILRNVHAASSISIGIGLERRLQSGDLRCDTVSGR